MRVLVVADLHYALRQYDWLLAQAPRYDVVMVAGDLLDVAGPVDRRAQAVVVGTYLDEIARSCRLLVCSGNHDLDTADGNGELEARWLRDLGAGVLADGATFRAGRVLFTVCPWWDGPVGRAAIGRQLEAASAERQEGDTWIWVHHAPPADSPVSWNGRRHHGDTELRALIGRFAPDLVLSGHVHPSPFVPGGSWADRIGRTWVFNTGQQIGEVPAHIVLDIDLGAAAWFSFEGSAEVVFGSADPVPVTLRGPPAWLDR